MYIRRKVFSILTDEAGEERLYSVNETLIEGYGVEEEREFARGVGSAVKVATQMARSKGQGVINKAANKIDLIKKAPTTKFINSDSKKLHAMRFGNKPVIPQQSGLPTQAKSLHDKITMKGNLINDLKKNSGLPKGHYRLDHPIDFFGKPGFNYAKLM